MQSILMRALAWTLAIAACTTTPSTTFTAEQLQDPTTCLQCHKNHFDEWSASMHSYASNDPVFVAMNKRGQRDTNNQLGTFCVQCHAPMAVALQQTDGIDFDPATLTPATRGITCFFCHSIKDATSTDPPPADDDNSLVVDLANTTMHGQLGAAASNAAHHTDYSARLDLTHDGSKLCGPCHDVVTPNGSHLERTYAEWTLSFFSNPAVPPTYETCANCHMPYRKQLIADDPAAQVKSDDYHEHLWPGIDQTMTVWPTPDKAAAASALMAMRIAQDLQPSIGIKSTLPLGSHTQPGGICLPTNNVLTVRVDTFTIGHAWPSGAAQDRRAWLEIKGYDATDAQVFSSGIVADDADPVVDPLDPFKTLGMWDQTFTDTAKTTPAHFFWDVVAIDSSFLLRQPVSLGDDHGKVASFDLRAVPQQVDRVEVRVLIRPYSFDVLDQLIASGDLDPSFRAMNTALVPAGSVATWTRATADPLTYCNP